MEETIEKSSNIINFPNIRLDTPPQSLEEMKDKIEEYRMNFSWEVSEMSLNNLLSNLCMLGMPSDYLEKEECKPHIYLLFETIRSLYLHSCNIDYDLQEFAKEYYDDLDMEELTEAMESTGEEEFEE